MLIKKEEEIMDKKGLLFFIDGEKVKQEMPKQQIKIYNYTIFLYKKFNWFHRLMFRLFFGIKIEKVED